MSRRKQSRPRHLEDEPGVQSPAIAAHPNVFEEGTQPDVENIEQTANDSVDGGERVPPPMVGRNIDAHVCGKCRAEFLELTDFVSHKKQCIQNKVVLLHGNDLSEENCNKPDLYRVNGIASQMSEKQEVDNLEAASQDGGSDGEQHFENLAANVDEPDTAGIHDNADNSSEFDEMDDEYKSVDMGMEHDDDLGSMKDSDNDTSDGELMNDKHDSNKNSDIPPFMLGNLLPTSRIPNSQSNVLLEPLEATKAAVAQFAENNLPPQGVVNLQSTLFGLQQQQIMQMQMIHQLQQQLLQSGQLPAAMLNGQLPLGSLGSLANLASRLNIPGAADFQKNLNCKSPLPEDLSPERRASSDVVSDMETPADLSIKSSRSTVDTSELPSATPSKDLPAMETSPLSALQNISFASPPASTRTAPITPLVDFGLQTPKREVEPFVNQDDPFFKHKCRLCHKVFGSDSALQIHFRSHTDAPHHPLDAQWGPLLLSTSDFWTWEKPFKCNICGGRFSTRGNLKVHFTRHKDEFPDVEMNPNPVPEHMDKNPNPFLTSPFPPSALTPFAGPAGFMGMPGLMNGLLFPPPHLAPRLPMSHLLMPKPPSMVADEKRAPSPQAPRPPVKDVKKELNLSPRSSRDEAPHTSLPQMHERATKMPTFPFTSMATSQPMNKLSHMVPPMTSIPLVSNYPAMSPLPSAHPFSHPHHPILTQTPMSATPNEHFHATVLPASILDNDDDLEQYMEIDKSETHKLQQLVDNIEHKVTDPNQCVICHRVLSCKSALQMHYRIHTGERPFKCKICGRSFTTKGNLKTHMGVHRAKPPLRMMHQCPVCHKQFTNLLVLQQHIRSHTGMTHMPAVPNLTHLGMFGRPGMGGETGPLQQNPLNMTQPYHGFEKELDLSKKPRLDDDVMEHKVKMQKMMDYHVAESLDNPDVNTDDIDDDEQNEMDDEANKIAASDAKKEGLMTSGRSSPEDSNEADIEKSIDSSRDDRPKSNDSVERLAYQEAIRKTPSPKYIQDTSSPSPEGGFQSYSTSLAALEERVRAIDSSMARNPLSQFHTAPFLLGPSNGGMSNGERSYSPRSESGSEGHDKDTIKPATPALSVSSDGSMGNNFMLGVLDLRPKDGSGKSTTCNVCYKTFACRSALDIHYRSHTKQRPYKCDFCDRSFTTRGNMKQHMLTHKIGDSQEGSGSEDMESNNNNSAVPNKNENNTSDSSNDSSQFSESQPIRGVKREYDENIESHNSEILDRPCSSEKNKHPSSSSSSTSLSNSHTHSHNSHHSINRSPDHSPFISKNSAIKHQCLVCQKGFSSASALQIHIRTHTGDKPFKCSVCAKAFTTKGNLKVHMGTHMWNNSPSRRGRRMSIEPPFMLTHKDTVNPYLPHGFPPRPEFYPFQYPPFMNGLPTPLKSVNDIPVIQGLNNRLGHGISKREETPLKSDFHRSIIESHGSEEKERYAESGELDLSMKSIGSTGSRESNSAKTSPSSTDSSSSSGMLSPVSNSSSLGWGWKASCHMCSRSFPTPSTLEHHVRTMHLGGESAHKIAAS